MNLRKSAFMTALTLLLIVPSGCGDDEKAGGTVFIDIQHDVGGAALVFNTIQYTNAGGQQYSIETLKYYLSDVVFHRTDGSDAVVQSVHYRDAQDPATETWEVEVSGGTYDAMTVTFGLDEEDNVTDGLPATQENINMKWPDPMGGGYHYMKLEGKFIDTASGDTLTYTTHTGRNGANPHFFEFTLGFPTITVDGNDFTATLVMDLAEWYTNPNDYLFPVDNPMIMGNTAVQDTLQENGQSTFSLTGMTEN